MRTHFSNTVRACFTALLQISSVRWALPQHAVLTLVRALVVTKLDQCNPVLVGASGYLQDWLQSLLIAATRLVRKHYSIASGTTQVTCPGAHPVPVVCSGISLCAWNSTSVSGRQPAADIRCRRSSSSSFCRQPDAAGAVNSSGNSRRPCVTCGCSAGMEQVASTDQDRLLSDNIPASNQCLSFPPVIQLMEVYHCPFSRWRTELEHVFLF